MGGSEAPNMLCPTLSWAFAACHARISFCSARLCRRLPLSPTALLCRAPSCPGLVHSIKLVGHPGPVTRLLSCTKARGQRACL